MSDDIATKLTKGEPGPLLIEAAQEIRRLRNYVSALREESERSRVRLEGDKARKEALNNIVRLGSLDLSNEFEAGLRGVISAMTDCAREATK